MLIELSNVSMELVYVARPSLVYFQAKLQTVSSWQLAVGS